MSLYKMLEWVTAGVIVLALLGWLISGIVQEMRRPKVRWLEDDIEDRMKDEAKESKQ